MATKNTTPEQFDTQDSKQTTSDVLQNESNILASLLELGNTRNNPDEYHTICIRRKEEVKLQFRIRPLSEQEMLSCSEQATKYAPAQNGKPRTPLKTDTPKMRSLFIYTATVDEDRKKIWDNPQAKASFNVLESCDMIDIILKGGEKEQVLQKIDEISGYYDSVEDVAKN